jgi:hypothetical protein
MKAALMLGSCDMVRRGALRCKSFERIRNPMLYPFELRARIVVSKILQRYCTCGTHWRITSLLLRPLRK